MKTVILRFWIPALVLLLTSLIILSMFFYQISLRNQRLINTRLATVQQTMAHLQKSVESGLTGHHPEIVEQEISELGTIPEISAIILMDDKGVILNSLQYAWKKHRVSEYFPDFDLQIYHTVLENQHFHIAYHPEHQSILALYPVRLTQKTNDDLRSSKFGALFMVYDLSRPLAMIGYDTLIESGLFWLASLLLSIILIAILTRLVTHPVSHLSQIMLKFARDEQPIKSKLNGKGELAILGKTFNHLVSQLSESKETLIQQKNLYNTLSKTNQMIVRVENDQMLFKEICQIVVDHGGFVLAWIGLTDADTQHCEIFARAGRQTDFLINKPGSPGITAKYSNIEENHPVIINDFQNDPVTAPWHHLAAQAGIHSCARFAVTRFNQVVAELTIYSDRKNHFTTDIIRLLQDMSRDISFALDKLKSNEIRLKAENDLREREENLAVTLNSIGDAVIVTDHQGLITRMNPIAESLTGWKFSEAKGRQLADVFVIINAITRKRAENPVEKVMKNGLIVGLANHTALISKTGKEYQIADSAAPIIGKNQQMIGVILVFHDVTEQYLLYANIEENEQRFRHVHEVSGAYIWEVGLDNRFTFITDQCIQVKGYPAIQLLGHTPFEFMPEEDRKKARKTLQNAIANKSCFEFTHRNLAPDGKILWEEVKGEVVLDETGRVIKIRGAGISINARKKAEVEIRKLAFYDPLTNLPNRRLLIDRLKHEINAAKRHNSIGAILFFDLDHFKNLNDSLGHDAGDELLVQIARRLLHQLRSEDTAARLGGDEFVILLTNLSTNQDYAILKIRKVTEKIHLALQEIYYLKGHEYHLSISIGITLFPQPGQKVNDLLKQADTALYRAKSKGRNNYQFFRQEMQEAAHNRLLIEKELHTALSSHQLSLYYQPQINAEGQLVGAETLIRWFHPEKGLITPNQFIPVAEESGLILKLGQWILDHAFAQMKLWQQTHVLKPEQKLSINISPKQFRQENFVREITELLHHHDISADLFIFEITENLFLYEIDETIDKMQQLKKLGVSFSIDDFGTGYSSLAYLKRLPLTELKIDKTFINDLDIDNNDQVIIETIIAMAKHMQLRVIAEGVETSNQLNFLLRHGCYHYQGYYFSKPLDHEAFQSYLTQLLECPPY